ncbi:MAG: hypothetical protein ACR2FU_07570 [Streptosporangiaceae bacterium]
MPELTHHAAAGQPPAIARERSSRRRMSRRGAAGLSAAGLAATMILTMAASSAIAAPARPDHTAARTGGSARMSQATASRNTSATQTTTTSSGDLTVTVRYRTGHRLRPTILSVSYSGGAKVHVKQPSLIFAFAPRFPLQVRTQPHPAAYYQKAGRPIRVFFFQVRIKAGQLGHFAGSLPARDLKVLNTHRGLGLIPTVVTTLAHLPRRSGGRFSIRPVLQNGMILLPHIG